MERLLDRAADELDIDRVEIRRRNYLTPNEFPHDHEIIYQDFAPLVYDSGNYAEALDRAVRNDRLRRLRVGRAGGGTRRGPPRGNRGRLVCRGRRCRAVRGSPRHHRTGRAHQPGHRRGHAGPGTLHVVRAAGGRGARGRGVGRRGGDRRHGPLQLGHRNLCQPRRGRGRERLPRGRGGGAKEGARPGQLGAEGGGRRPRAGRRTGARRRKRIVGLARRPRGPRQPPAWSGHARHRAGSRGHRLLRPGTRRHGERSARHDPGGRSGHGPDPRSCATSSCTTAAG